VHLKNNVLRALLEAHPYEEVAWDLYPLLNEYSGAGIGCTGIFRDPPDEKAFLGLLSEVFNAKGIRYSGFTGRRIRKVALCGGSGAFLIETAISSGADAFVTGDVKYHDFFKAGGNLLLADIGHYESEIYCLEILYDLIIKNFPNFALRFSEIKTNPINYY
jgi:putative NIF3 family GTP cyclohydrolase 1 type 2